MDSLCDSKDADQITPYTPRWEDRNTKFDSSSVYLFYVEYLLPNFISPSYKLLY